MVEDDTAVDTAGVDVDHLRAARSASVAGGAGRIRFAGGVDESGEDFGNHIAAVVTETEHPVEAQTQWDVHAVVVAGVEAVGDGGGVVDAFFYQAAIDTF